MSYQTLDTKSKTRTIGHWQASFTQRFQPPTLLWSQSMLFVIFGLLVLFVILSCTLSPTPLVAVALVVVLAVLALAVLRPSFVVFLVYMGAGLPTLLIPLRGHPVRPVEAALLLCLLVILLRRSQMRLRFPHLVALLFIAIAVISFIHVPEISADFYSADKRLYEVILIFMAFFFGTFLAKYIKDTTSFLVAILLSNIPLYLIGLAQALHIHISSILESSSAQDPRFSDGRLWGPTPGAVIFGSYLVNLLAIALACWMLGTRRRDRIIGGIFTLATGLEIVGSGTRGSAIAAFVIVIAVFILAKRFKLFFVTLLLMSIAGAIFFQKVIPLFLHDPTSANNRLFLSIEAIKLISTHLWIGIGLQQFHYYYAQLIIDHTARLNAHDTNVHQQYLEWGVESGIAWLIAGVLLLLSILYSCWRAYRIAQRQYQIMLLAVLLAVLANIITSFFDVPLDQVEGAVFFFLLAGLALGCIEYIRRGSPEKGRTTIFSSTAPKFQASSTTGVGNGLYRLPPRHLRVHPHAQPQLSSPDVAASSASERAPNAQKAGRTIVIQIISWGIALPIIFPMTALLTRYLGPVQYGEYSFTFSFFAIFALLSGTGMDPFIIRRLSRQKHTQWSETLSYAAGTRLLTTALSACAAALLAFILPMSVEQHNLLLLGSVSLFFSFSFNGLRLIYSDGFRAEQRAGILFLLETTNRVITAGLVLLIVLLHLSLLWAYALIVYSDIPFFIIQVFIARRRFGIRLRFSLAQIRELFVGSLSLTGYDALALINGQADLILLLALAGPLSVGIYALATRLTDPLLSIAFAYTGGVYPVLCKTFEEERAQFVKIYQQALRILALGIIPLAIYVSIEAKAIVILLGGQRFSAAAIAVQLLIWATATSFFQLLTMRACTAANMERLTPMVTLISTVVNLLLNFVLIPPWHFVGAGIAALSSEVVGLCLYSTVVHRHVSLLQTLSIILRVFLGNLPMLLFLLWQQQAPLLLTAPIAIVLSIIGCMITRTLSLEDISMARRMLLNMRNKGLSTHDAFIEMGDWPTTILPRVLV